MVTTPAGDTGATESPGESEGRGTGVSEGNQGVGEGLRPMRGVYDVLGDQGGAAATALQPRVIQQQSSVDHRAKMGTNHKTGVGWSKRRCRARMTGWPVRRGANTLLYRTTGCGLWQGKDA